MYCQVWWLFLVRKGYTYKKALQLIAYEKGKLKKKPALPRSRAMRGAIRSTMTRIRKKRERFSTNKKMRKIVFREAKKHGLVLERVAVNWNGVWTSGRAGDDINLTIDTVISMLIDHIRKNDSPKLKQVEKDLDTDMEDEEELLQDVLTLSLEKDWGWDFDKANKDLNPFFVEVSPRRYLGV